MYKVFINEKVIIFTNKKEKIADKTNCLVLNFFSDQIVEILYDWIERNLNEDVIIINVDDVENAFTLFKKHFKIINAAGGVVRNSENKTLFIYRLNKWDLPKGKVEEGESVDYAAMREVEEECAVSQLKIIKDLPSTFHIYKMGLEIILKETFWFEMNTDYLGELIPQKEEGIERVEWFSIDEIKSVALKNTYTSIADFLSNLD